MGRPKITHCKRCGKFSEDLSARKLCRDCSADATIKAIRQIRNKSGEIYEKWLENMRKALERM